MKQTQNFRFKLTLDTRYKSSNLIRKEQYPVKLYVTAIQTKRSKYISTDVHLSTKVFSSLFPEWTKKKWLNSKNAEEHASIAKQWDEIKEYLNSFVNEYINAAGLNIETIEQLQNHLGKTKGSNQLKDHFDNYQLQLKNPDTRAGYTYSYKSFVAFHNGITSKELTSIWKENKKFKSLSIYDITPEFLGEYCEFMRGKSIAIKSVKKYCMELKTVLNAAINDSSIPYSKAMYPFGRKKEGKFEIPDNKNTKNKRLRQEDFIKLNEYLPKNKIEQLAVDCWLFSYYSGGVNLLEICELRRENLNLKDKYWTYCKMGNEKKKIKVKLVESAEVIILRNRWGESNKVFNFTDTRTSKSLGNMVNKELKKIAKHIEIDAGLHMQMAKHTAFSNLYYKNVPFDKLIDVSGHTKVTALRNYIKSLGLKDERNIYEML